MQPSDLALVRVPGAPTLSPDSRLAVVAVSQVDLEADDTTSQLWAVPTDGSGPPRQLTYGWADSAPRFSPDGRWLAFLRRARDNGESPGGADGKPQLYLLPVHGGEARQLTRLPSGAGAPAWSPDSSRLAYATRVPTDGRSGGQPPDREPPRRITRLLYRIDGEGFLVDRPRHVFVLDVLTEGAEPTQITGGECSHGNPSWSPDGEWLTLDAARHATHDDDGRSDVWICRPDGADLRALTDTTLAAERPQFTADGTAVCFLGAETGANGRDVAVRSDVLWRVPVDGSAPASRLLDQQRHHLGAQGGTVTVAADGLLFPDDRRGSVELLLVPFDGGEPQVLIGGERQATAGVRVGETVVAVVTDPQTWGDLELSAADGGPTRRLTDWSGPYRGAVTIAEQREMTARAPDGYDVHGWVVRPPGEGPHPVLLMIHGGPYAQYGWQLFDEAQVYAAAGYAVVMGNPRGSSGYGEAHGRAILGNVGEVSATDLLALLDAALAAADLDGERVGVLGGSHGGFMTTWMAAHHGHRFRAAISERALNAIDSFEGSSDVGWSFADSVYGTDPERRAAQSPLTYADRIDIPMLIIHSEQDWRCPLEQAQRLFVALKRRGAPVEMLLFPGEGHELSRSGLPSHRIARFEAILEWWARYL